MESTPPGAYDAIGWQYRARQVRLWHRGALTDTAHLERRCTAGSADGWELCSAVPVTGRYILTLSQTSRVALLFRRPRGAAASA